jgi:hypothetical protein
VLHGKHCIRDHAKPDRLVPGKAGEPIRHGQLGERGEQVQALLATLPRVGLSGGMSLRRLLTPESLAFLNGQGTVESLMPQAALPLPLCMLTHQHHADTSRCITKLVKQLRSMGVTKPVRLKVHATNSLTNTPPHSRPLYHGKPRTVRMASELDHLAETRRSP